MKLICAFFGTLFVLFSQVALGHGDNKHKGIAQKDLLDQASAELKIKYEAINATYIEKVKPIFKNKCFDCHGDIKKMPWYYSLPIAKQIIDEDIEEAMEDFDMSKDLPFIGHGNVKKDLFELKEIIEDDEMPPWQYKLIHWKSGLTEKEKKAVIQWVDESVHLINKVN